MRYAAQTSVSCEKSKAEIERILARYDATAFAYAAKESAAMIEFQIKGKRIRFVVPMPDRGADEFLLNRWGNVRRQDAVMRDHEQSCRQRWRALALVIKAKLEFVASGIVSIESEFMAQLVLPGGQTAGERFLPRLDEIYATGKVPTIGWDG